MSMSILPTIFENKRRGSIVLEAPKKRDSKSDKYSPTKSVYQNTKYRVTHKIGKTAEGSIYTAFNKTGDGAILKRAGLNDNKLDGDYNLVKEAAVLEYLNTRNPPKSYLKKIKFFKDDKNFFLLIQDGGKSFFNHIIQLHYQINNNKLSLKIYKQHIKNIFRQMVTYLNWLHNTCKMANLNININNVLIKNFEMKNGKILKDGEISFVNYDNAKSFMNVDSFDNCKKFVGNKNYISQKNYFKKKYNAAKEDIWGLAVIYFIMLFGKEPCIEPNENKCKYFKFIKDNKIYKLIKTLNKSNYVNKNEYEILCNILCVNEQKRYDINQLKMHSYIMQ